MLTDHRPIGGIVILMGVILTIGGFDSNALHVAAMGLVMTAVGVFILHKGDKL